MPDRYVSTTGTDSGSGLTPATAWATLEYADANATATDTIYVEAGTYTENPYWTCTGKNWVALTSGEVIVQSTSTTHTLALSGTTAKSITGFIIDGEDNTTNTVYTGTNGSNNTLTNCTLRGSNAATTAYQYNNSGATDSMTFEGCTFEGAVRTNVFNVNLATNVTINNCTFSGTTTALNVIETNSASGDLVFSNNTGTITVTNNTRALVNHTGSADLTMENNNITFDDLLRGVIYMITAGQTGSVTTNGNKWTAAIFQNSVYAITAGTHAVSIQNDIITTTGVQTNRIILIRDQDSPSVKGCTIDTRSTTQNISHIVIESTGTASHNPYIGYNTCYSYSLGSAKVIIVGSDQLPYAGQDASNDGIIEFNTVYCPNYFGQTSSGIHAIEYGYNLRGHVRNNIVYNADHGIVIKGGDGVGTGSDYAGTGGAYSNILIDCNSSAGVRVKGITNSNVCNNTFHSSQAIGTAQLYVTIGDASEPATGTTIKNNIFLTSVANKMMNVDTASLTNSDIDYNQYFYTGSTIDVTLGASVYTTVADIVSGTTYEDNGSSGDPLLDSNYVANENSPCIGTGIMWWGTEPNPVGRDGEPFSDFDTDKGTVQSKNSPFHPSNL